MYTCVASRQPARWRHATRGWAVARPSSRSVGQYSNAASASDARLVPVGVLGAGEEAAGVAPAAQGSDSDRRESESARGAEVGFGPANGTGGRMGACSLA